MVGNRWDRYVCRGIACAAMLLVAGGVNARAAGNGVTEERNAAISAIEVVPNVIRFVDVPLGETYTQSVRLANLDKDVIEIQEVTTASGDFGVSGLTLPVTLGPGSTATLTISYRPTVPGRFVTEMRVLAGDAEPLTIDITASAIQSQTELASSEADIHFNDVAVGGKTGRELTLTNTGNKGVRISRILVSSDDFSVSGSSELSLSPDQNISLEVSFNPRGTGEKNGMLTIFSENSTSPLEIPLSGSGAESSGSSVGLKWEGSPLAVHGYLVYRSEESSGPYARISSSAIPDAEFTDSGLAAGHTYYYVVSSLDANNNESEFSEQIIATVP